MAPDHPAAPTVLLLTAPTGAGKSALAMEYARTADKPVEIVSADAFTVYRHLDIGTAKPTTADLEAVPHHLIDNVTVHDTYDVARFCNDANAAIRGIQERGHRPLVVGGTTFYLQALIQGLPLTPAADPTVRAEVEKELRTRGWEALLLDIQAVNPVEAERMQRNPRRIARATEIFRMTGKFPSAFGRRLPEHTFHVLAYAPDQARLEQDQVQRIESMIAHGWPAEAQWLASQVDPSTQPRPTVWQALGYLDVLRLARGEQTHAQTVAAIALKSRQYAKRQLTAIRSQLQVPVLTPGAVRCALDLPLTS